MDKKEIDGLIDQLRGSTQLSVFQKEVEKAIKADAESAKTKAEEDSKKLEKIKEAEKKLREEADTKDGTTPEEKKRDKSGKFLKTEPETPEETKEKNDTDNKTIKKLTEQMTKMSEEIDALKKRKNYRTPPPKGDKVDEPDDFIKQNITKDFEMVV